MSELKFEVKEDGAYVQLPAILDLAQGGLLLSSLEQAFQSNLAIHISALEVERATTGPIQILIAAYRECGKRNLEFKLQEASEIFEKAVCELGFSNIYNNWSKI